MENYPDFKKLVHVNMAWSTGFIVKNIKDESMEANALQYPYFLKVCSLRK